MTNHSFSGHPPQLRALSRFLKKPESRHELKTRVCQELQHGRKSEYSSTFFLSMTLCVFVSTSRTSSAQLASCFIAPGLLLASLRLKQILNQEQQQAVYCMKCISHSSLHLSVRNSLRKRKSCGNVDEVLVVEFVVLSEAVHVSSDLRGAGSFYSQGKVRKKSRLITGIVQYRSSFHFGVQSDICHFILPELDRYLK